MIPGLNFFLRRVLPLCLGGTVVLMGTFVLVWLGSWAVRYGFDFAGHSVRAHTKWLLTPKNLLVMGLVVLSFVACILVLYFSRWM